MRVKYTIAEAFALGNLLLIRYPLHEHLTDVECAILLSFKSYFRRKFFDVVERAAAKNITLVVGHVECMVLLKYFEFVEADDPFETVVHLDFLERLRKAI